MRRFSTTVLRNSAFGIAAQLAIKALSFGFTVLVVRHLGAEAYGQYAAVLAFGAVFAIFSDLGLSPYAIRQVARWRDATDGPEHTDALYGNILTLRLLLALPTAIALTAAAWLTGRPLMMIGAIALNAIGLIIYSAHGTADVMLAGFERLDLSAGAKVLNQLIFVLIGTAALWVGFGYYGLIVANLLGVALMTWVCWRNVRALGVRSRRAVARSWPALLRASLPLGVIGFALGLSYKFDSVLLNIFRGDAETGYYNAVYNLIFMAVLLSNVFNTTLYPSLARQAISAPNRLPAIYERALRYLMALALPIAAGAWVLADQLVPFLFESAYLPAVPAFQILIWVIPLMFASEFLGYVMLIAGKESRAARAILVSTGLNVTLNLLLVPRFGFLGAAVMTLVTELALVGQFMWMQRALMRQINWRSSLVRPLLAALLMGAVVLLLRPHLPFIANVALGAVTYGLLLVAFGVVGRDELRFVRSMHARSEAMMTQ